MKSPLVVHAAPGAPMLGVIAGHDPSGGAGVLADADAARAAGVGATLVVTAWTDQDEEGLRELGARSAQEWLAEARRAFDEPPAALKLGLLPGAEHVDAACTFVTELRQRAGANLPIVVDPVLRSSSGFRFADEASLRRYLEALGPLGLVWTPNVVELAELAAGSAGAARALEPEERVPQARALLERGAAAVLVKGGHGLEDPVRELLLTRAGATWLEHPRIQGATLRGSGCRHATTLAAALARGASLEEAARQAAEHVRGRLATRPRLPEPPWPP